MKYNRRPSIATLDDQEYKGSMAAPEKGHAPFLSQMNTGCIEKLTHKMPAVVRSLWAGAVGILIFIFLLCPLSSLISSYM